MDRTKLLDLSEFGEVAQVPTSGGAPASPPGSDDPKPKKVRARPKSINAGVKVDGKQVWPESKREIRELHEKLLEARKSSDFPTDAPQWMRAAVLIAHALKTHRYWMIPAHILYAANDETLKSSGKYGTSERNLLKNIMGHKKDIEEAFGCKLYQCEGHIRALVDHDDYLTYELPRVEDRIAALGRKAAEVDGVAAGKDLPEDIAKRVHKVGQVRTLLLGAGKKNDGGDD